MTDTLGVQPTYEQLRDSVENNEARAAWLDHDRRQAALTETYRTLKGDTRYTEEHKANQMWEAYSRESAHIQAAGEKARELLEREAKGHEMMSIYPDPRARTSRTSLLRSSSPHRTRRGVSSARWEGSGTIRCSVAIGHRCSRTSTPEV